VPATRSVLRAGGGGNDQFFQRISQSCGLRGRVGGCRGGRRGVR
jgi:hypothetical protein